MKPILTILLMINLMVGCSTYRAAQLYQSGTEALDRGEIQVAVAELQEASRLEPKVSEIQNHLGLAYAAAGAHTEALAAFQNAVELDCENEAAQRNLAAAKAFRDSQGRP